MCQTAPAISMLATSAAVLALLLIAILQAMLVFRLVSFEQTIRPILLLGVVIGVWWLVIGALTFVSGTLPTGIAWTSLIADTSFVIIAVGFWPGGPQHPLAAVGSWSALS